MGFYIVGYFISLLLFLFQCVSVGSGTIIQVLFIPSIFVQDLSCANYFPLIYWLVHQVSSQL